jgi:hypothetical protein
MTKAVFAALLALSVFSAEAAVAIEGIDYPDAVEFQGQKLSLVGAGMRKKLFFKVYSVGIYLPAKAQNAKAVIADKGPVQIKLGLLRNVSASSFVEALDDGIKDNSTAEQLSAVAKELDKLHSVMNKIGDVKEGDIVTFNYSPKDGTSVVLNGKTVGSSIGGKALYDAVLRIWLGEKPIDEDLKAAIFKSAK